MEDKKDSTPVSPSADSSSYVPRRSNRVSVHQTPADGDTWYESLSVCEGATATGAPRLMIRSYFRNQRTQERVWDEPPSGASNVQFAAPEKRQKAQDKMNELQITLDMIPPEEVTETQPSSPVKKEKKGGFLRNFGRKKEKQPRPQINEAQDLNLQRAIARSMAEISGVHNESGPVVYFDTDDSATSGAGGHKTSASGQGDDDEIALAKALSMSESAHNDISNMSEEEQMLIAMEHSRIEAEQASMKSKPAGLSEPSSTYSSHKMDSFTEEEDEDDMDLKMPAVDRQNPFESPPPSPVKAIDRFDPYSPSYSPSPADVKPASAATSTLVEDLLVPPTLPASTAPSATADGGSPSKPKRILGRIISGGRRDKAMAEKAGVV